MAGTFSDSRLRVRKLIDDLNEADYAVSSERLDEHLFSTMQEWANEVGVGPAWATAAIALLSTTSPADYALPSSVQYAQVLALRLTYDQRPLLKVTVEEMNTLRRSITPVIDIPYCYALQESSAQAVTAMFYPQPDVAYTVDLLRSLIPTAAADSSPIPFADPGCRSIEKEVAATLLVSMSPEQLAKRQLAKDVAAEWLEDARNGKYWEKVRVNRLKRAGHIWQMQA